MLRLLAARDVGTLQARNKVRGPFQHRPDASPHFSHKVPAGRVAFVTIDNSKPDNLLDFDHHAGWVDRHTVRAHEVDPFGEKVARNPCRRNISPDRTRTAPPVRIEVE